MKYIILSHFAGLKWGVSGPNYICFSYCYMEIVPICLNGMYKPFHIRFSLVLERFWVVIIEICHYYLKYRNFRAQKLSRTETFANLENSRKFLRAKVSVLKVCCFTILVVMPGGRIFMCVK